MKRAVSVIFAFCMALLLTVPAFADVLPPTYFRVTVGDKPITRYRMIYDTSGQPSDLLEDGKFRTGDQIDVTDVILINGTKYGAYTTWNTDEPITNEHGVRLNQWKTYYFLLEDALSPKEIKEADKMLAQKESLSMTIVAQSDTTVTSATETQTANRTAETQTAQTQMQTANTTAETTTEAETTAETETAAETEPTAETETAAAEETTASGETQGGRPKSVLPVCIAAAGILGLTAAVTLVLIRRKKQDIQNESKKEEEQ